MDHLIPTMTHPLSRHWDQPSREGIFIVERHAFMTRETWRALATYSSTVPSGAYEGKMWKCLDLRFGDNEQNERGWLRWWAPSPRSADHVMVEERFAVVVSPQTLAMLPRTMGTKCVWDTWYEVIGVDPTVRPSADAETVEAWANLP